MSMKTTMTETETLALTKLVSDATKDAVRAKVKSGRHSVDVTVKVEGFINVGDDYPMAPTAKALSLETIAILLAHCGVTRDAAVKAVVRAMNEAKTPADEARQALVNELKDGVNAILAQQPKITASGRVTAKLTVTKIEG